MSMLPIINWNNLKSPYLTCLSTNIYLEGKWMIDILFILHLPNMDKWEIAGIWEHIPGSTDSVYQGPESTSECHWNLYIISEILNLKINLGSNFDFTPISRKHPCQINNVK